MKFKDDKNQYEYEKLFAYDLELTKLRWTVFAALFSVSLIILGLALNTAGKIPELKQWTKYAIAFGFLVYLTAAFHYWWHHKISHRIRRRLKELESSAGIEIVKIIRIRPRWCCFKIYFHWAIWIWGLAYAFLTFIIVKTLFFICFIGGLILLVIIFALGNKIFPGKSEEI